MPDSRLELKTSAGQGDIQRIAYEYLKELTGKDPSTSPLTQKPLRDCCTLLQGANAVTIVVQRRVLDPDFLAEYGAYYSRQFSVVEKYCTRLHFFSTPCVDGETVLNYLDRVTSEPYLGFLTLRPVIKSPVGASIIQSSAVAGFIRSKDKFPVHISGKEFSVTGTPFMQQDNAVGACAQAAIWMSLRTLRKREGDRAHDPAQITDAATKYFVNGRVRPNRQGLTLQQMVEAIRAAGYSPHAIPIGDSWHSQGQGQMTPGQVEEAMRTIHPYIESEIPVILILFPPSGGHAIVLIGHTWDANSQAMRTVQVECPNGFRIAFNHAASWVPTLIVHNDNAGPYKELLGVAAGDYTLQYGAYAIPLLPADVFMSAEEALTLPLEILGDIFGVWGDGGTSEADLQAQAAQLTIRLSLVEKRKLRKWATSEAMAPELKEQLRLMDLPKRLWVFELHQTAGYGGHEYTSAATLVGLVLIDSTGDVLASSVLLMHLNLPAMMPAAGIQHGVVLTWDAKTGIPSQGIQTNEIGLVHPIRH